MNTEDAWFRRLDAAAVIVLVTAALYVVGDAHTTGFCDEFGLPPGLFDLPFERTVFAGFFTSTVGAASLSAVLFAGVALFVALRWWTRSHIVREARPGVRAVSLIPGTFVLVCLIAFVAYVVAHNSGHRFARMTLETMQRNAAVRPDCLPTIEVGDRVLRGFLFFCSPTNCAIFSNDETEVVPREAIKQVVNHRCPPRAGDAS